MGGIPFPQPPALSVLQCICMLGYRSIRVAGPVGSSRPAGVNTVVVAEQYNHSINWLKVAFGDLQSGLQLNLLLLSILQRKAEILHHNPHLNGGKMPS